jgi:hypothetical protein
MGKEDVSYIEEQSLSLIDPMVVDKWGDPNKHPETMFSKEQIDQLLEAGREMFITHVTKDGFPMVTVHVYVLIDGVIWSTTIKGRVKERIYRRDPRCGLCISTNGLNLKFGGAMTIKARAEVVDDPEIIKRVCEEHGRRYYSSDRGQQLFATSLLTPNRVALRFHIDKIISWSNIGIKKE